ncbi:CHAD domain-containing protein [Terriglobus roseus]|uniref:CHAD domain-containing protein n=1 Tax=Terriglobus roseus TaxID=392734 RepID=A0A1H4LF95_9BACT|nr:CHAD domain-containing protein [Terriglobus roseus]SEB69340.1 CHAD domain-containing protein [Terriglobus roseus]
MTIAVKGSKRPRVSPLAALEQQVVALDAAMLVAVTATEVGAVHKLRTTTRRVEAQMRLLELMATGSKRLRLPDYAAEAKAVRSRLRKVRRAAGVVRDLDVQTTIIRMDAPLKSTVHKGSPGDTMRRQAKQLRKHLDEAREHEAQKLQIILQAEEHKLAANLRALEKVLKPAESSTAPPTALSSHVQHWFALQTALLLKRAKKKGETAKDSLRIAIEGLDEDGLHAVRKAAKLCRYMAESAPEGTAVRGLAERFESMQEAGGRWHDWLLLEQLAHHFHGKGAELTERYAKHRDSALADYHLRLSELLPTVAE